jgi:hypothetical protein
VLVLDLWFSQRWLECYTLPWWNAVWSDRRGRKKNVPPLRPFWFALVMLMSCKGFEEQQLGNLQTSRHVLLVALFISSFSGTGVHKIMK